MSYGSIGVSIVDRARAPSGGYLCGRNDQVHTTIVTETFCRLCGRSVPGRWGHRRYTLPHRCNTNIQKQEEKP